MHVEVLAELRLKPDAVDARVVRVQALDDGPGVVGGAVVDEDQLERPPVECGYRAPVELLDRGLLVQEVTTTERAGSDIGARSVPPATARPGSTVEPVTDAVWRDVHRGRVWRLQACRIVEESAELAAL